MRTAFAALFLAASLPLQAQTIDEFFEQFTAEWVRGNAALATSLRYFEGEEQDRLDREIPPLTPAHDAERTALAKRGLEQLRGFDRASMTEVQRVSADLLDWQLQAIVNAETFPTSPSRSINSAAPMSVCRRC